MPIKRIDVVPTISTGIYAAGDNMGGKLTLTSFLGGNNKGTIKQIVVTDLSKQNSIISIAFFSADPSATTFTDNGQLTVNDTDAAYLIGHVAIAAADYLGFVDSSVATKACAIPLEAASGTVYASIVCGGTPTYAGTADLKFKIYVEV
jgi:hypothetical protein